MENSECSEFGRIVETMGKFIDLTGLRFGRLKVVSFSKCNGKASYWNCVCDCGNEAIVRSDVLRRGISRSCGCLQKEVISERNKTHGLKRRNKRLYNIWLEIKRRCLNPKATGYERYGGRGITICEEWNNYTSFYNWAMANGYTDDLTIDRKNNDGNYYPENCHWTTMFEQNRNKSNNRCLSLDGKTKIVSDWALEIGISRRTILRRLEKGFTIGEALKRKNHV
jgi:hypothetical protein